MPPYGPLQRRDREDAYKRDRDKKVRTMGRGRRVRVLESKEGGGGEETPVDNRDIARPNAIYESLSPLNRLPSCACPESRDIIFFEKKKEEEEKTRRGTGPISTGIIRAVYFRHPIASRSSASFPSFSLSSCHHPCLLPPPSPVRSPSAVLIVYEGRKNTSHGEKHPDL